MTVTELIELLKTQPPDAKVFVYPYDGANPTEAQTVNITPDGTVLVE